MKIQPRLLAITSAIIGFALFIYVINRTGLAEIWARVHSLGAGFLLIIAVSSIRYLSRTLSWMRCMAPADRKVGFWSLWRARVAGEAIGDLTFGPVVAEPMKLVALGDRVSLSSRITSLTVENIAYAISCCLMIMAGTIALLATLSLNDSLSTVLIIALGVMSVSTLAAVLVISRRWRLASGIAGKVAIVLPGRLSEKLRHLRTLEDYIFDFYTKRPVDFFLLVLCQAAFHLAGTFEIFVTLRLIGVESIFSTAFMLESFNRAINIIFIFVPALVGIDEAGTGLVAGALGFGAASGVALAIIRKIRMFFWIGIGLLLLLGDRTKSAVTAETVIEERTNVR
jgi:Lysylphosphatidylglycerol synthase TM region